MGVLHTIHPGMPARPDLGAPPADAQTLEVQPPGFFARNYGRMTPPGVVLVHVLYGLTVGIVYALLVS